MTTTTEKRLKFFEFIFSMLLVYGLSGGLLILLVLVINSLSNALFSVVLIQNTWIIGATITCLAVILGARFAWYAINMNKITFEELRQFLSTSEGKSLLDKGCSVVHFRWTDYEYWAAERYIELGRNDKKKQFHFDPFSDHAIFEDAVKYLQLNQT